MPAAQAPTRFRLTAERLAGWEPLEAPGRRLYRVAAEPDAAGRRYGGMFTYWQRRPAGDSIHVSYPLPLAGVALDLAPAGPDLAGWVTAFTDAGRPGEPGQVSRPVRARRVPCVNPAVVPHHTESPA